MKSTFLLHKKIIEADEVVLRIVSDEIKKDWRLPVSRTGIDYQRGVAGALTRRATPHRGVAFKWVRLPCGKKIKDTKRCPLFFGDPDGNRTQVTARQGRCLNRLTNGPGSGDLTRTGDRPGMNRVLYQLSYAAMKISVARNQLRHYIVSCPICQEKFQKIWEYFKRGDFP